MAEPVEREKVANVGEQEISSGKKNEVDGASNRATGCGIPVSDVDW